MSTCDLVGTTQQNTIPVAVDGTTQQNITQQTEQQQQQQRNKTQLITFTTPQNTTQQQHWKQNASQLEKTQYNITKYNTSKHSCTLLESICLVSVRHKGQNAFNEELSCYHSCHRLLFLEPVCTWRLSWSGWVGCYLLLIYLSIMLYIFKEQNMYITLEYWKGGKISKTKFVFKTRLTFEVYFLFCFISFVLCFQRVWMGGGGTNVSCQLKFVSCQLIGC